MKEVETPAVKLKHIVLFKYKDDVTEVKKDEIVRRFLALKLVAKKDGKPYITSIIYGNDQSIEGMSDGYEVAFIVSFSSIADRDYYVFDDKSTNNDPEHKKLIDFASPAIEKFLTVDFIPRDHVK